MKKVCAILLILLLTLSPLLLTNVAAVEGPPTRIINVVYDDSGSMYVSPEQTWCQAKYAMEVFAAMLGDTDTMNVYYMSDYMSGTSKPPRIILQGGDGPAANVAKIHRQTTNAGDTPFDSVRKAYADLSEASADEKWLVVLTDGAFENGELAQEEIDNFFQQKSSDVKVMFLAIGQDASGIKDDPSRNINFTHAGSASEILRMITNICNRIFNSNRLDVDTAGKKLNFDIPMSQLIVFVQGKGANLRGLKDGNGNVLPLDMNPIEIKYSALDTGNYPSAYPDTSLYGQLVIYQGHFASGSYIVDAENCSTLEVYYKPDVDVAVQLTANGEKDPMDLHTLVAGEYTLSFGLVDRSNGERLQNSKLLGDVYYEARIANNDNSFGRVYVNGDKVTVEEGSLTVYATASYLDYNSAETTLNYSVLADKQIAFTTIQNPVYTVDSKKLVGDEKILLKATLGGVDFTEEQWNLLDLPDVRLNSFFHNFRVQAPMIEKTAETGVFALYPSLPGDKPSTGTYTEADFTVSIDQKFGQITWSGETEETVHFDDIRPWWERNWDLFIKLGVLAAILVFLAGYLPIFKNYLPRSLKKKPTISCEPDDPSLSWKKREGLTEKNLMSTLTPYKAQTATIRIVPQSVTGIPPLKVKAVRRRRMAIVNIASYADRENITFNGQVIPEGQKKYETSAGLAISVTKSGWKYDLSLNR